MTLETANPTAGYACPNCQQTMKRHRLGANYGGAVDIDVCYDCNAIWFDQHESAQLSSDGVVELFQLINERGGASAKKLGGSTLRCVSCKGALKRIHDQVYGKGSKSNIVYDACTREHGRLTTFYQFLIEKRFVRELSESERAKLSAQVSQIRCSGCGAPVNLRSETACGYCQAPIGVFDRTAAQKAIDHYLKARGKQLPKQPPVIIYRDRPGDNGWSAGLEVADLAVDAVFAMARAASRGSAARWQAPVAGVSSAVSDLPAVDLARESMGATGDWGLAQLASDAGVGSGAVSGGALDSFGELFRNAGQGRGDSTPAFSESIGEAVSGVADSSLAEVAVEGLGEFASSAGEGLLDLVGDGVGALIDGLFS